MVPSTEANNLSLTIFELRRELSVLSDIYNRRYSDYTLKSVLEVLKQYDITADELHSAIVAHLGKSTFPPTPYQLLRLCRPDKFVVSKSSVGLSKAELRHEALRSKIIRTTGIRDAGKLEELVAIAERSFNGSDRTGQLAGKSTSL